MIDRHRLRFDYRHLHFIGIGGIGMSGLSELMINSGYIVSGSDLSPSPITNRLASLGATIYEVHQSDHITGADLIIYTAAVSTVNPELAAARQQGVLAVSRADLLGTIVRRYHGIAVAGTHGKTTTSAMIGKILVDAELDPTIVLGGILPESNSNIRMGSGKWMVVEADEYDRSFHTLFPMTAVITSIDGDHMEYYRTQSAIDEAFLIFTHLLPFDRPLIACLDDPGVKRLVPAFRRRVTTYGTADAAYFQASNICLSGLNVSADILVGKKRMGILSLQRPGKYHILNALAAIAVADQLEIPVEQAIQSLATYKGIKRRFEIKGSVQGVTVIDDYAHHPTEIQAVLEVLEGWKGRRLFLVFQPHLYSRTSDLAEDFGRVLSHPKLHQCIVTDIFPSREAQMPGVTGKLIVDAAEAYGGRLDYIPDMNEVLERVKQDLQPGDVLMTMGAGNIDRLGDTFIEVSQADI